MTLEMKNPEVIIISDSGQRPWVDTNGGNSKKMGNQINQRENKWISE